MTRVAVPGRPCPKKKRKKLLHPKTWERDGRLVEAATALWAALGEHRYNDHNAFREAVDAALNTACIKLSTADLKVLLRAVSERSEDAPPVIARVYKPGKQQADPLRGFFAVTIDGKAAVAEYEPNGDLRNTEQVPLLEPGGIEAFIHCEVLPYTPDAWIKEDATRIGHEISFTRLFFKPQPLRTLGEIAADILALEQETDGLLSEITKGVRRSRRSPERKIPRRKPHSLPLAVQIHWSACWQVCAPSFRSPGNRHCGPWTSSRFAPAGTSGGTSSQGRAGSGVRPAHSRVRQGLRSLQSPLYAYVLSGVPDL